MYPSPTPAAIGAEPMQSAGSFTREPAFRLLHRITCVASTAPLAGPATQCNRAAASNQVDAALIELDHQPPTREVRGVGTLAGWTRADDLSDESPVEISARSGHRNLYTAHLFVIGRLLLGTDRYCFKNLIELKRKSSSRWGITGTAASPSRPGDSGAWVMQAGANGPEWCGMVIGGDGPIALAVFSEYVLDWLANTGFGNMTV